MLFAEEFSVEIVLEGVFIHLPDREVGISIHDDTVLPPSSSWRGG